MIVIRAGVFSRSRSIPALLFSSLLAFALVGQGCSRCGRDGHRPVSDELVIHIDTEPPHLNPLIQEDMWLARIAINNIFEGLVRRHPRTYEFLPSLATRWEISENGRIITFTLRKNVLFHDGKPFGAKDVLFTIDQLMDPRMATAAARSDFLGLSRWEALDGGRIRFTFKQPSFKILEFFSHLSILPRHVYGNAHLSSHPANSRPVGTGPFRFSRWERGSFIRVRRNESYWGRKPFLRKVVYRLVRSKEKAFELLKKREIDLMPRVLPSYTCGKNAPIHERRVRSGYRALVWYPVQFYTVIFNMKNPIFRDARVRQAMAMLIDRPLIAEKIFCGHARIVTGPYWIEKPGYDKSIRPYPFDPDGARRLLASAGFVDSDGDGILDRAGRPFRLTYLQIAESEVQRRLHPIFQQTFRKAGIEMEIDTLGWNQVIGRLKQQRFDLVDLNWFYYYDQDLYQIYHSSQCRGGSNYGCYSNPQVDALLTRIRGTLNPEERRLLERKLHGLLHQDLPGIYLFNVGDVAMVSRRLEGVYPSAEWFQVREIRARSRSRSRKAKRAR